MTYKFWTIQKREIIKTIEETGMYVPKRQFSEYVQDNEEMMELYDFITDSFNRLNDIELEGVLFAFARGTEKGVSFFQDYEEFVAYMRERKEAIKGLWKRFLSDDYVVIEVDFPRIYNPMFVDINDFQFIMPPFMLVPPYTEQDFLQIVQALEQGKFYPSVFPSDQITDHPEYFVVSELIREKILHLTKEEIPHSVAVTVDKMQKDEFDKVHVYANIIVERPTQKGIIIGKGGKLLKEIGVRARKDIEQLLGNKVYLELWVKVEKDWRKKKSHLQDFGYRTTDYKD